MSAFVLVGTRVFCHLNHKDRGSTKQYARRPTSPHPLLSSTGIVMLFLAGAEDAFLARGSNEIQAGVRHQSRLPFPVTLLAWQVPST